MTTELTIDERNQRSFDTFRKIFALGDKNGNPRFPLADKERQDDYFVRGCPSGSGDYYLYWHLKEHRFMTQDEVVTLTNDYFGDIYTLHKSNKTRTDMNIKLDIEVRDVPIALVTYQLDTTEQTDEPYITSKGYTIAGIYLNPEKDKPEFYLKRLPGHFYNQSGALVWINSGSIFNTVNKSGQTVTKPARITDDLDVVPFLDSPLSELPTLRVARDIYRERKANLESTREEHEFPLPLMCTNLANVTSRIELLRAHYKQFDALTEYLNPNKYTTSELVVLMNLRPKLTPEAFRKVVAWVRTKDYPLENVFKNSYGVGSIPKCSRYAVQLYASYLQDRFGLNADDINHAYLLRVLADCEIMRKRLRLKFDIKATSMTGFIRYHDKLVKRVNKLDFNMTTKIDTTLITPFERDDNWLETWQATEDALLASDLDVKVLNTPYMLKNEGWTMNHCVGGYVHSVRVGHSYIVHLNYNDKPYTLELVRQRTVENEDGTITLEPYIAIGQIHGRYNAEAPQELTDRIQVMIDTVNKNNEKEQQSA